MSDDAAAEWITDVDASFAMKRRGINLCWRTISKWRDAERIPCRECDGIRRVKLVDVIGFYEAQTVRPGPPRNEELSLGAYLGFGEL